ncbi:hypothetical protein BDD12DRAFT_908014 [Trichophaea hybrida]|nr:hypothetical protein BDD12DRAFT_894859 [Trichophaea hybrida]KAF8542364.1 hypothetical protein BDD12DRAFT_908014 [Trichophaea hybrida]
MERPVAPKRWPKHCMLPPQLGAENSSDNNPWYHDPDYPDNTVNLRREANNETPPSNAYIQYRDWILEIHGGCMAEYFDMAEERAAVIEDLTAENEIMRETACGEDEADRAARETLAARREVAELCRQLAEAGEQKRVSEETARALKAAVRMIMATRARSQVGAGNVINAITVVC